MASRLFYILILVIACNIASSQKRKLKNIEVDTSIIYRNPNCLYRLTYNVAERRSFFPFNSTNELWLLSFPFSFEKEVYYLSFDKMSINSYEYIEAMKLSDNAIDSLTDILYNQTYSNKRDSIKGHPVVYILGEKDCYKPRNAIVFLDINAKPFAFIEICFECENYRFSSEAINAGEFCSQK